MTIRTGLPARELYDVMTSRSSVRAFRSEPIDRGLVERAIEAAGWAPSPHGTQPWRFVIVDDRDTRYGLADAMAATWREQLRADSMDEDDIERRLRLSKDRLEQAPVVVVLCLYLGEAHAYPDRERQEAERLMAVQSLGAAAQNFLLAIEVEGLSAGWMCAPLFCPVVIRDFLGLDADLDPQAMFPVGRMARPPRRRPRRPLDTLIVRPGRVMEPGTSIE